MPKFTRILSVSVVLCLVSGHAFSQQDAQTRTISGLVSKVDAVGDVVNVKTERGDMAFSVSGQTRIVQDTKDIGMLSLGQGHPVTVEYVVESPGKYKATSMVDNQPGGGY